MLRRLRLMTAGALVLSCLVSVAHAQGLDVQATLEPFSAGGGFEHGRLVLRIHNDTGAPVSGIQVRLDGSALDLQGNGVMQLDGLDQGAVGMVTETYTTRSDVAEPFIPLRIAFSGPAGANELRTVSPVWKIGSEEE